MKRLLLVVLMVLIAASLAPAAPVTLDAFQSSFQDFADGVAGTLASTATSTGLGWSPAYIGQFPHFGVGVSVGASLIPFAAVESFFNLIGVELPSDMEFLRTYGVPLPAAALDARIGGFGIPFDIGLKFGYLPEAAKDLLGSVNVDYLMAGADFRLALLKDKGFVPGLSVGVGYTYYKGAIGLPGIIPGTTDIDITELMNAAGYSGPHGLSFSSPDFNFNWQSNVIEAKVQVSKTLLFITPHIGMSAAYGISSVGGGLASALTVTGSSSLATIQQVFKDNNLPAPTSQGIDVKADSTGWALRAFGGVDIALLILHLDLSANYNLLTGSYGGGVNLRLQI